MITCEGCGTEAPAGQRFCGQCGLPLVGACPSCGAEHAPGQRFCGSCGTPLAGDAVVPGTGTHQPIAAERRMVSVLFVDLVGFTSFSEARDPEDVRALITEYFEVAREVIERFGGTVDKFIGDAVMAWWGATASQEDDAERAVRAALEVVDRVTLLGEKVGVADLAARAGVMTGEASVGPGGNEKGLLLGDLVNSASRLQSIAAPGTVLVGPATAGLVASAIELADAGTHEVKGKDEPLVASRAVRMLAERGGRGRTDILEPPFVGRASELRLLKEMLHATGSDRRARLVSLVGQAGIGKSRLIWEFRKYVDGLVETVYWHEGRSPSYGDSIALWALGEMIRNRARIQETDDDETTLRLLAECVEQYVADPDQREWIRQRLGGLLGMGDSAGSERTELFAAARAFFEQISARGTTVMVFEDLHWADPSLLEFIEELPDWSQNHPILIVTMARPDLLDRRPDWGSGRRGFTSLYVGPLTDDEMTELIEGAVPGIPADVTGRIVDAAGGVPLFAVEMIRMLMGDGRLVADGDGVVAGDVEELAVPTSVQAVISARLDRLPAEDRDMARDASVLGYSFTAEGLAALRDEPLDKVERRLSDLIRREILELVRDPLSPERGMYRWVQSLLREVAYGRIGRADRHTLHLRAARYFRDLEDPELAPVAAAHYVAATETSTDHDADLQGEMVTALRRALDRSLAVHAHEQILHLVDASLPVVPDDAAVELREIGAAAAVRNGALDVADRHVDALVEMSRRDGGVSLTHRALALQGWVANETRRSESARQILEDHLEAHPELSSDPNLARVAVYLARSRMLAGDEVGAAELADTALAAVEPLGMIDEIADALVTRGTALAFSRSHQGMALLWGALKICREHGLLGTGLRALINIGYASRDFDESFAATKEAFEEAKRIGDRSHAVFAAGNLIGDLGERLELEAFEALLGDPVLTDVSLVDEVGANLSRRWLASLRGDRDEAWNRLRAARELAEGITDHQALNHVQEAEVDLRVMDGDFATPFQYYKRRFEEVTFVPWLSVVGMLRSAALEGRLDWMSEALDAARTIPPGPTTQAIVEWAEGMSLLLTDAEAGSEAMAAVIERLSSLHMSFQTIIAATAAARHLPLDHPSRAAFTDRARSVATAAGATGLVRWIEQAVST